jgi:predicted nucleic acid-binding protein
LSLVALDTTVASFLFAGRPEVALYERDLLGNVAALPFQARAEMLLGAQLRDWGQRRRDALTAFTVQFPPLLVSDDVVSAWVTVMSESKRSGVALADSDGWVAACAMASGAPLLTHDTDFRRLKVDGLRVICHAPIAPPR